MPFLPIRMHWSTDPGRLFFLGKDDSIFFFKLKKRKIRIYYIAMSISSKKLFNLIMYIAYVL